MVKLADDVKMGKSKAKEMKKKQNDHGFSNRDSFKNGWKHKPCKYGGRGGEELHLRGDQTA